MCFCCSETLKGRKGEIDAMAKLLLPVPNKEEKHGFKLVKTRNKDRTRDMHL